MQIRNGKMTNQRVGISFFQKLPRAIAHWLQRPDAAEFTAHCFRATAATWMAKSGASHQQLMSKFGWRNAATASRYVRRTTEVQQQLTSFITSAASTARSSSTSTSSTSSSTRMRVQLPSSVVRDLKRNAEPSIAQCTSGGNTYITVSNNNNCTIVFGDKMSHKRPLESGAPESRSKK